MEVIKTYKEHLPALRLIGKQYFDSDRDGSGTFGAKWGDWFSKGWFSTLEILGPLKENGDAYMGCMKVTGGKFSYWIGMFFPQGTEVPEGFEFADLPEGDVGVNWIYGSDDTGELYGEKVHLLCMEKLSAAGMRPEDFENSVCPWVFERYNCPRFTTPDQNGNVILDYGIYLKAE